MKFAYITAIDISNDNDLEINKREFVNEIVNNYNNDVICVAPHPSHSTVYLDERIEYVTNHRRHHPLFYLHYCYVFEGQKTS